LTSVSVVPGRLADTVIVSFPFAGRFRHGGSPVFH
jgi:hypothetical protein